MLPRRGPFLVVIAGAGACFFCRRGGKSFFASLLTGVRDHIVFDMGHTTEGQTRGMWACCVELDSNEVLIVVDCEGLADTGGSRVRQGCLIMRARLS